jgi:hypothetical protein
MDPARFVFLDETATTTAITKRYGRSPSDQRLVAAVPHGHWRTTTLIAGLGQTGIIAPLVLDGPMTGVACHAYVEQFLTPVLAPGDVVVLDNLAAHKVDGVRQAIAAAAASTCRERSGAEFRASGGTVFGFQSWVALPTRAGGNRSGFPVPRRH